MNSIRLSLCWLLLVFGWAVSLRAADAKATLSVLSQEGAKIFVDGVLKGQSPDTLTDLPAGKPLKIRLELEGFQPLERTLTLPAGGAPTLLDDQLLPIGAKPPAAAPSLEVKAPLGANVLLNGVTKGAAPLTLRDLPVDQAFTVRIELEGYTPVEQAFTLPAGRAETFAPKFTPVARSGAPATKSAAGPAITPPTKSTPAAGAETAPMLSVITQEGAKIFVDGVLKGRAPDTLVDLPIGKPVKIRLELEGHEPLERAFTLAAGKVDTFEVELQPIHPGFELTTIPGANVIAIAEDGRRVPLGQVDDKGVISSDGKISGKTCTLIVSRDGYEPMEQKVTLDLKNKVKIAVTLRPRPARVQIVSVPAVTPEAGEVFVNDAKRPVARGGFVEVTADTDVTVEVRVPGYAPKSQKAKVRRGEEQVLTFGNLDPISGQLRVAAVTEQGPVPAEFHTKGLRAFVDSREVPWNRGALVPLPPGRHEIMVIHESYNVVGGGPLIVDVKENGTTEATLKVEMKAARLRLAVQARDKAGQPTRTNFVIRIDNQVVERSPEDVYDVPGGREFTVEVIAENFVTARQKFDPIGPEEEEKRWSAVLSWDAAAEQRRLRTRFEGEMAKLLQETENRISQLRRSGTLTAAQVAQHRQWVKDQRLGYDMLQRTYAAVATKNDQIERNLTTIEAAIKNLEPVPKGPSPF